MIGYICDLRFHVVSGAFPPEVNKTTDLHSK